MDKNLIRELVTEEMDKKELIDLVNREETRTIKVTSDLTLKLQGERVEGVIYVTVDETGKPNEKVRMSLLLDFGIFVTRDQLAPNWYY